MKWTREILNLHLGMWWLIWVTTQGSNQSRILRLIHWAHSEWVQWLIRQCKNNTPRTFAPKTLNLATFFTQFFFFVIFFIFCKRLNCNELKHGTIKFTETKKCFSPGSMANWPEKKQIKHNLHTKSSNV